METELASPCILRGECLQLAHGVRRGRFSTEISTKSTPHPQLRSVKHQLRESHHETNSLLYDEIMLAFDGLPLALTSS